MKALFYAVLIPFLLYVTIFVKDSSGETEVEIEKYGLIEFTPKIGTILITDLTMEDWPDDLRMVAHFTGTESLSVTTIAPYAEMILIGAKKKTFKISDNEVYVSYSNTQGFRIYI